MLDLLVLNVINYVSTLFVTENSTIMFVDLYVNKLVEKNSVFYNWGLLLNFVKQINCEYFAFTNILFISKTLLNNIFLLS